MLLKKPERAVGLYLMSSSTEHNDAQRYRRLEVLGRGPYGKIIKALDTVTNHTIAMKQAIIDWETDGMPTAVMREVVTLKELADCECIVSLLDVVVIEQRVFLICEYLDADLRQLIQTRQLELRDIKRVFLQILEALEVCHSRAIMHRDLRPENVLLDLDLNVKLTEFSLAKTFQFPVKPYTKGVQSLWYRAPEVLLGSDGYSAAIDIWSAGCILTELFNRSPLFNSDNELGQLHRIFSATGTPTERNWPGVTQMSNSSPIFPQLDAVGFSQLVPLADSTALDLIQKLLALNPSQRISAKQARSHPFFN
jgi:cyclin-dependent kinase